MIPQQIKVGSTTYEISLTQHPIVLNTNECVGLIDFENAIIRLSTKRNKQKIEGTFWHECIHAIVHERDIDFGNNEEEFVDRLSKGLFELMVDNPFLLPGQDEKVVFKNELMEYE